MTHARRDQHHVRHRRPARRCQRDRAGAPATRTSARRSAAGACAPGPIWCGRCSGRRRCASRWRCRWTAPATPSRGVPGDGASQGGITCCSDQHTGAPVSARAASSTTSRSTSTASCATLTWRGGAAWSTTAIRRTNPKTTTSRTDAGWRTGLDPPRCRRELGRATEHCARNVIRCASRRALNAQEDKCNDGFERCSMRSSPLAAGCRWRCRCASRRRRADGARRLHQADVDRRDRRGQGRQGHPGRRRRQDHRAGRHQGACRTSTSSA